MLTHSDVSAGIKQRDFIWTDHVRLIDVFSEMSCTDKMSI